ncbi:AAA family ATPase [Oricola sp.]|uniref:AAA family ATPase n=1 Tax=Oricola sp. TaxID=1979950 RepID=UPI0025FF1A6E|nr:AAA family ATPase [Oricola sp.]MCI5074875.1 AAA family ATPase [Oricola sp.]
MFIESIAIENIRSLSTFEANFVTEDDKQDVRQWSLFVGENGTGKSTVLKAVGLLLAGSDSITHLIGNPSSWVRRGTEQGRIAARLRTSDWEPRDIELVIKADDGPTSLIRRNLDGLAPLDDALEHADQNYFAVGYGPYRRLNTDPGFASSSQRIPVRAHGLATLFDTNIAVHPIQEWAMDLDYRRGEDGLDVVRRSINTLMPDVGFLGIDKDKKTLMFQTLDGEMPLEQLSDGYQNVAAWIGDLLYRVTDAFSHHNNPLNARGILLIDEIDAHLHPSWQRRLRQFLSNTLPNFQILATTHSALTLQQAHEGEAMVLTRGEENRVAATTFPGDPSKLRLHQIYDLGFKISSLDSWEIEKSKDIYRELSGKARSELSDSEAKELDQAEEMLEVLPSSRKRTDALGNEVLQEFYDKLDATTSQIERRLREE